MFDTIINWLAGLWETVWGVIQEIWRQTGETIANAWTIGLLVIGWVWWAFDKIGGVIATLVGAVDAIAFPSLSSAAPGTLSYVLSVANSFFPVDALFAFLVGYVTLRLSLTVYKLIKSWIPTLS